VAKLVVRGDKTSELLLQYSEILEEEATCSLHRLTNRNQFWGESEKRSEGSVPDGARIKYKLMGFTVYF
jgi:hypothetical protein